MRQAMRNATPQTLLAVLMDWLDEITGIMEDHKEKLAGPSAINMDNAHRDIEDALFELRQIEKHWA